MKKILLCVTFGIFMAQITSSARADETNNTAPGAEVVDLILMRPGGLLTLIAGSAIYVGLSPLTAFASISPPHDAFERLAKPLIVKPFAFTFDRPLGNLKTNSNAVSP